MDAMAEPEVAKVVISKGSQVGYTEILNNTIGYYIDQDPSTVLIMQPTLEMAQAWSKDRLAPMVRDTPALTAKVSDSKARDSGNTMLHKTFPGGQVTIVGANSPASLASRPIRIVLADEVDRYPVSAGDEGDPLKLAQKRQLTFWNRKTLVGSTPTIKGESVIDREFQNSDRRRYFVPCPDCGVGQYLKWSQVHWNKHEGHRPETAHYVCEDCGSLWNDAQRWAAIRQGEWRATAEFKGTAGFHIPGLLSPWVRLEEIVTEFLEAKDHPELLKVWTNTVLGETWEERGETVSAGPLLSRIETYDRDSIPDSVRVATAGVDVQGDRLEVQTVVWGAGEEAWVADYVVLHGDPSQQDTWQRLDQHLLTPLTTDAGRSIRIHSVAIDTGGHHAAMVLAFCKSRKARRVWPIKGAPGAKPVWPVRASKTKTNENLFIVGVDTAKDAIYGRLRIPAPAPGYVHFPQDEAVNADYFFQLTAEQAVTRYRDGRPYRVWVCGAGKRNEALDTFVYAYAALKSLRTRLDVVRRHKTEQPPAEEPQAPEPENEPANDNVPVPDVLPPRPVPAPVATPPVAQAQRRRGPVRRISRSSYL
ncbi:phage terminase large subunit family protein [Rhizobium sp. BR 317]|uniref:phage terminase large subunit family protein n=1 Tax=Rhizobium sp. BR 317 TaxID=3040015 RepID=UPI0039BF077F